MISGRGCGYHPSHLSSSCKKQGWNWVIIWLITSNEFRESPMLHMFVAYIKWNTELFLVKFPFLAIFQRIVFVLHLHFVAEHQCDFVDEVHMVREGLVNVPLCGFWTSLSSICWIVKRNLQQLGDVLKYDFWPWGKLRVLCGKSTSFEFVDFVDGLLKE